MNRLLCLTLAALASNALGAWQTQVGPHPYTQQQEVEVRGITDTSDMILSVTCNQTGLIFHITSTKIRHYSPSFYWRVDLNTGGQIRNMDAIGSTALGAVALNWQGLPDGVGELLTALKQGKVAEFKLYDSAYNPHRFTLNLAGSAEAISALDQCPQGARS